MLFAAYPEPWSDKSASHAQELIDAKVRAYVLAVQGIPAWAIEQAVTDFIQGRVERRARGKLPAAEEIAFAARKHVEIEASRQMKQKAIQSQLDEAEEWKRHQQWLSTPEGQAHQKERARKAAEILARASLQSMPKEE
ncbi:hypothetical protein [Chelativorans xinjiangense]|uniref:hypothetical protein n=1 Tax=Chelativorans xinjiangense TaxID=2681485 RepID=UPI00135B7CD5|nr:hypothetical protein [Chelativorans xinjiangense]